MDDAIFALSKQKRSGMYAGPQTADKGLAFELDL